MLSRRSLIIGAPALVIASRLGFAQTLAHDQDWAAKRIPNELLIRLNTGFQPVDLEKALRPYRADILRCFPVEKVCYVRSREDDAEELAKKLEESETLLIREVLPNSVAELKTLTPNDPYFPGNGGPGSQDYLTAQNCNVAWGSFGFLQGRSGIVPVYDFNTGIDATHPDLSANVLTGYNAYDASTNVSDATGHGTLCMGFVAGSTNNAQGIASVSGGGTVVPVKCWDPTALGGSGAITNAMILAGLTWVLANKTGPGVLNFSISVSNPTYLSTLQALWNANFFGFGASGDANNTPSATGPCNSPFIISVGGNEYSFAKAAYSGYGPSTGGLGPGCLVSAIASATACPWTTQSGGGYTNGFYGTSFTAPQLAAAAQYLWTNFKQLRNFELWDIMTNPANGTAVTGWPGSAPYNNPANLDLSKLVTAAFNYRGLPYGGASLLGRR